MSDVDFAYLFGEEPYQQRASALLGQGTSLPVVITRGNNGAIAWHAKAGQIEVAAPKVEVADTIGAGDSFQAALLFALHKQGRLARVAGRLPPCPNAPSCRCPRAAAMPPHLPPEPSRYPVRPAPLPEGLPLADYRGDPLLPQTQHLPAGERVRLASPDVNQPAAAAHSRPARSGSGRRSMIQLPMLPWPPPSPPHCPNARIRRLSFASPCRIRSSTAW